MKRESNHSPQKTHFAVRSAGMTTTCWKLPQKGPIAAEEMRDIVQKVLEHFDTETKERLISLEVWELPSFYAERYELCAELQDPAPSVDGDHFANHLIV